MKPFARFKNPSARQYSMKASGDTAEILIYEVIGEDFWTGGGVTAKGFSDELKALGDVKTINLRINSPGGSVFDGVAIYNNLAQHPAKVNVYIDALAASIASIIAMAGDTITMAENAMMMIHNPWALVVGDSNDMRKEADLLDKIRDTLVTTYATRTGKKAEEITAMMDAETWFTAEEAKEAGFADAIVAGKKAANLYDLSVFKNAPTVEEPLPVALLVEAESDYSRHRRILQ